MNTKEFRWPVRVYYEDTDAGGVVYHARYIVFYERARTEMLREYQVSQQRLLSEHRAFVVRRMDVEFFAAARLDDLLEVRSRIATVRGASLTFEQRIYNTSDICLGRADVLIVCVEPSLMKPVALPKSIVAEFSSD